MLPSSRGSRGGENGAAWNTLLSWVTMKSRTLGGQWPVLRASAPMRSFSAKLS